VELEKVKAELQSREDEIQRLHALNVDRKQALSAIALANDHRYFITINSITINFVTINPEP